MPFKCRVLPSLGRQGPPGQSGAVSDGNKGDITISDNGTVWRINDVFNVKSYGAIGDGVTEDTAAINAAIAAFNTAGGGVLYFPKGLYLVSGGTLTTIIGNGSCQGQGVSYPNNVGIGSRVISKSSTATLFRIESKYFFFQDIYLINQAVTLPSDGSAVLIPDMDDNAVTCSFYRCVFERFFDVIDFEVSNHWVMDDCRIYNPVNFGIRVRNLVTPDAGDWNISNSLITTDSTCTVDAAAGLRVESSGGGKIVNTKFNGGPDFTLDIGIDIALSPQNTIIFLVSNSSIENYRTHAFRSNNYPAIAISNCQIGAWLATAAHTAFKFEDSSGILIDNIVFSGGSTGDTTMDFNDDCNNVNIGNWVATHQDSGTWLHPIGLGNTNNESGSEAGNINVTSVKEGRPARGIVATINAQYPPSATTIGRRAFATDANSTTFGSVVAGGGSNTVPIYDDGTDWRIG